MDSNNRVKDANEMENVCLYCDTHSLHPMFCYLIVASNSEASNNKLGFQRTSNKNKKSDVSLYIGVSRLPFDRLKSHNACAGYRFGSKSTKALAGQWKIKMIVGPWFDNGSCEFKKRWRKNNKTIDQAINFGVSESALLSKTIYSDDDDVKQCVQRAGTV